MKVAIADAARRDLASIGARVAIDNPPRAARLVVDLENACLGLADFPYRFSLVPRYEHYGLRRRIVSEYLIFYRVTDQTITVARVLHGATDYASILFADS